MPHRPIFSCGRCVAARCRALLLQQRHWRHVQYILVGSGEERRHLSLAGQHQRRQWNGLERQPVSPAAREPCQCFMLHALFAEALRAGVPRRVMFHMAQVCPLLLELPRHRKSRRLHHCTRLVRLRQLHRQAYVCSMQFVRVYVGTSPSCMCSTCFCSITSLAGADIVCSMRICSESAIPWSHTRPRAHALPLPQATTRSTCRPR